jgi:hypothetical protein
MARPVDYVLRVYPTEQSAIEEDNSAILALQVLGDEVTATTATADYEAIGPTIQYTLSAGQSPSDLRYLFSVGEYLTVTGFDTAGNNVTGKIITAVTATTITINPGASSADETKSGSLVFKQASSARPHIDNNNQSSTYTDANGLVQQNNFFTQERMFYRFDVPTAATEFYVDWDDGDDNTPEKANFSVKKYDLPRNVAIFEHTYTKHGQFFPMLRVTSPDGYKSKYYTTCNAPRSSYRELEATHDLTATAQSGTAEQNFSVLSLDSNASPRIPSFIPSNYPPVGVLKVDPSSVYAGIDNTVATEGLTAANTALGAAARGYVYIDGVDLGIRHTSGISGGVYNIQELVEVVYIDTNYTIRKQLLPGTTGTGANLIPDSVFPSDGTGIKEIISVKLRNVKELSYGDTGTGGKYNALQTGLYPDERVWIRLVDQGDVSSGHQSFALYNPTDFRTVGKSYANFCCVSNGNPYVSINDPRYRVMADGSDSIARNSNVNIVNYWLYDDKLRIRDKVGTTGTGTAIRESILNSDATAGAFVDKHTDVFGQQVESTTDPKQAITYNLDYMRGQQLDDKEFYCTGSDNAHLQGVGRFYDDFRLLRLQVEDSSEDGPNATVVEDVPSTGYRGGDRMDRSFIEHDSNYKRPNGTNLEQRPGSVQSNGLLLFRNSSDVWVDLAPRNPETNKVNFGGDGSNLGSTSRLSLSDTTDINSGTPKNWLLAAKDRKFSKIFFRMDNDTLIRQTRLGSKPQVKLVAWYTGPSGWKPLAIKDETIVDHTFTDAAVGKATALYRSGPVSWDIPEDWTSVSTGTTGYTTSWSVPEVNYTHGSLATSSTGSGVTVDVSEKKFSNVTDADRFITGDAITVTATTSHNGNYTVASSTATTITVNESLAGSDDGGTACTINHNSTITSGAATYGSVVPIPSTPQQKWQAVNWPQRDPTGEAGGYGILIGILCTSATGIQCYHTVVCDNQHSRIIRVVDPKHISLNEAMIAQSIGFTRKGKYHSIIDKLGKSEIRRLGAAGGRLSFGSVSMGDNTAGEGNRTRERFVEYQKAGTPIYYDVRHNNGTYTRLFGVLDSISEDIPIGKMHPKIGVSMIVSHIIEYSSDGVFTSEVVSIGGLVDTDNRYLQ